MGEWWYIIEEMNKSIQTNYSYLGNLFIEEEGDIGICDGKHLPIKEGKINIVNKNLQTAKYLNLKDYSAVNIELNAVQVGINLYTDETNVSCELFSKNSSENLPTEFRIINRDGMEPSFPKEKDILNIEEFFINDGYNKFVQEVPVEFSAKITSNVIVFFLYSDLLFRNSNNKDAEIILDDNHIYTNEKNKKYFGMYFNCPNGTYNVYHCNVVRDKNNQTEEKQYGYVIRLRDKKTKKLDFMNNE